jgi:hypothetical protein
VFPNRIENGFHKQAAAAALGLLLCSWPVRLGFCFDATCIINLVPSRNPSKLVVVSHGISPGGGADRPGPDVSAALLSAHPGHDALELCKLDVQILFGDIHVNLP